MRVRVLGGLAVDDLAERDLGSRKARTLLKVLAVARGSAVSAERLVDILWGDHLPARPVEQVGILVSRFRAVLGAERLVRTDAGYALRADWLDVDELRTRVGEAAEALAAGRIGAARAAASAAGVLARGPVLPEEDGDWVDVERAATDALVASARRVAAEAAERAGDHAAAVGLAEEALAHDPYDEATLRIMMRAHVAAGRPASALAAYVRVRDRLVEDLGVSPTDETEALHDSIVVGDTLRAAEAALSVTLPGRAAEVAALDRAFEAASTGLSPVTIAVVGDAGMGKTALVEHWCAGLGDTALTLVGRCDSLGRDLPLQPIADALASELSQCSRDERSAALGDDAMVLRPLLGLDAVRDEYGATVVTELDVGRARLFNALLGLLARLADERVPVVVVDDLHLAGESTLAWLRFAARRPQRLLLVGTSRRRDALGLEGVSTLELAPLDVDATAEVVGAERAAELHGRSGGNPLLLAALSVGDDDGRSRTLQDAVARRIEGLGEAATTIRTAAVFGTDIDLDLLADVLRAPSVELLEHLEAAAAAGLVIERGAGFAFRHELEREVLDSSAGPARRALVHRTAARSLAGRGTAEPLVVAVHARLGGDVGLAVASYTRAAGIALSRYDTRAAEAHLDAALALAPTPGTFALRARLRMATFRLDDAAQDARRAVDGGGGAEALEVSGWVAYYRHRYEEALTFADAAVERSVEPGLQVSSLALAGRVRHARGDLVEAVADLERATGSDAPAEVRALAAVWLAHTRVHQGRPGDALALLDRALVEPDRLAHPFAPLHGKFSRALALGQLGRVEDALRACDELDALVERSGETGARMVARSANTRAWILRWTGRPAEADDLNLVAIAAYDPLGPRGEAYYAGMLDLADGRLLAGDDSGAADLVGRIAAIETWDGTMAWHQRHRWALLRARLALGDGDADTAAALSVDVARDAAMRGARRYELFARAVAGLAGAADPAGWDDVIAGLRACAALDGGHLVAALTSRLDGSRR